MAARLVQDRFPTLLAGLLDLVRGHQRVPDEPLHLAIVYADAGSSGELRLLEVIGNFGGELVDPDRRLLEITYPSTQIFPDLEGGCALRLVLTSPSELRVAVRDGWGSVDALRAAIRTGAYEVLVEDGIGAELMAELARALAA